MTERERRLVIERLKQNHAAAKRASNGLRLLERRLEAKGRAEAYRTALRLIRGI